MAELRCPMCSKPNPDTNDSCQYCGARIKPLILPQTGSLPQPPDSTHSAQSRPQPAASGGSDNWLDSLRGADSPADSSFGPADSQAPESSVDDWLARLRMQDEAAETPAVEAAETSTVESDADFLTSLGAAEAPAAPPASGDDWLNSLRASTDETVVSKGRPQAEADLPPWVAPPNEPAADADSDWTSEFAGSADETVVHRPAKPAPKAEEPESNTDWLTSFKPQPPKAVEGATDWFASEGGLTPTPADEMPDWLKGPESPVEPAKPKAVEGASDRLAESQPAPADALPDWFDSPELNAASPTDASKEKAVEGATDWLASGDSASSDLPDWLTGAKPPAKEPAPPKAGSSDWLFKNIPAASDDWLKKSEAPTEKPKGNTGWLTSSLNPQALPETPAEEPPLPSADLPDWLQEPAPSAPAEQKAVEGATDWLASTEPAEATDDLPDWMKGGLTAAATPAEQKAIEGTTDWLAVTEPVTPEPTPGEAQPPKSVVGSTDWFKENQSAQAPSTDWLTKENGAPRPVGNTGWLSSLGAPENEEVAPSTDLPDWLKASESASPAEQKAVEGTTEWLATTEPVAPEPTPGEAQPPKSVVGSTDWLKENQSAQAPSTDWLTKEDGAPRPVGNTGWLSSLGAPESEEAAPSTDLPDWLKASEPAPPAEQKAIEGTTDWLATTEPVAPEPTPGEAQLPKSVVGSTDWFKENQSASAQAPSTDWLTKEDGAPRPVGNTGWLSSLQPGEGAPEAAPGDVPEWLKESVTSAPAGPKAVEGATDWFASAEEPLTPSADVPDWLKTTEPPAQPPKSVVGSTDWFKENQSAQQAPSTDWLTKEDGAPRPVGNTGWLSSLQPGEGAPEAASGDMLDWLKDAEKPPSAAPGEPESKSVIGSTDWFKENQSAQQRPSTDWLTKEGGAPRPVGNTGWLSSLQAPEGGEATAPGDVPEWLKDAAPSTPPGQKSVVGSTDWLKENQSAQQQPSTDWLTKEGGAPRPVGNTGWLSSLQASEGGESAPPADVPEWLKDAAPSTPPGQKSVVGSTDWLKENQTSQPSTDWLTSQGAPRPVGNTGWLSSLQAPEGGESAPPADVPEWLKDAAPSTPAGQEPVVGSTDWFKEHRPAASSPEWLAGGDQSGSKTVGTSSWLSSLQSPEPQQKAVEGSTDWLAGDQSGAPIESPPGSSGKAVIGASEWLGVGEPSEPGAKTSRTGWLSSTGPGSTSGLGQGPSAIIGNTDWLAELASGAPDAPGSPAFSPQGAANIEMPDWMKLGPSKPADSEAVVGTTDWFQSGEGGETSAPEIDLPLIEQPARKADEADLDWLATLQPASPTASPAVTTGPTVPRTGPLPATTAPGTTGDLPPWLAALRPSNIELPAAPPEEVEAPTASVETAAWGQPETTGADETLVSAAPSGFVIPKPIAPKPVGPNFVAPPSSAASLASAAGGEAAPAGVPPWLRALRPVEATVAAHEPDLDREETAGPLAGMRGVLPAESAIAVAGQPGESIMGFALSDSQNRLAEKLAQLILQERIDDSEIKPRTKSKLKFDFSRVVVAFALLAVVIAGYAVPKLLPGIIPGFLAPALPSAGAPLQVKIESLPADQPVLIAVEYEPAYSGELNPAVESVMVHLFKRGARVITVSSSPAGAGLAQMMLAESAAEVGGKEEGTHYLNLGYIPGGITGLQQFASNPAGTIQRDFSGAPEPFQREVLAGFTGIDQFTLIIAASGAPEPVQGWIEQVQVRPAMQGKLAAITSAAAEPIIKPYTAGDSPAISALLSGYGGAAQYDQISQRNADQWASNWLSFGFGLMAGVGILTLGAAWNVFKVLTSSKPARARAGARAAVRAATAAAPVAVTAAAATAEEAPHPPKAKTARPKSKTTKAKKGKTSAPAASARPRMRKV